jgi:hypothetical protein
MFGWLFSSCPVDLMAQRWIEKRLRWLTEQFGEDLLLSAPNVVPTDVFFPDRFSPDEEGAEALVARVATYMHVPMDVVELRFFDGPVGGLLVNEAGHTIGGTAGLYQEGDERFLVHLNRCDLAEPMSLVGTIAHARLLGENRISPDAYDNELLTDLTVVFHGLGVFLANMPRAWPSDSQLWPGTGLVRPEYMTIGMFAYALALRSELRFETDLSWSRHLTRGARSEFNQAMRFLRKQAK